jgi:hypothetical protein
VIGLGNYKGYRRKWLWSNLRYYPDIEPEKKTMGNQSEYLASGQKSEPGTSWI